MAFRDRTGLDKRRAPVAASIAARRRHGFPSSIQLHRRLLQPLQYTFHVIVIIVAICFTVPIVVVIDYPRTLSRTVHVCRAPPELQSFFFFGRFVVVGQQDMPDAAHPRGPNHQSSARRFPTEKLVRIRVGRLHNRICTAIENFLERSDSCAPGMPTEPSETALISYIIIISEFKIAVHICVNVFCALVCVVNVDPLIAKPTTLRHAHAIVLPTHAPPRRETPAAKSSCVLFFPVSRGYGRRRRAVWWCIYKYITVHNFFF